MCPQDYGIAQAREAVAKEGASESLAKGHNALGGPYPPRRIGIAGQDAATRRSHTAQRRREPRSRMGEPTPRDGLLLRPRSRMGSTRSSRPSLLSLAPAPCSMPYTGQREKRCSTPVRERSALHRPEREAMPYTGQSNSGPRAPWGRCRAARQPPRSSGAWRPWTPGWRECRGVVGV